MTSDFQKFPSVEDGNGACSAADSLMPEAGTFQANHGLLSDQVESPPVCGEAATMRREFGTRILVEFPPVCVRRYSVKLYPNAAQLEAIERQAVLCVHLWNAANDQRLQQMRQESQRKPKGERKFLTYYDQARELKHVRAADPEIAAMHSSTIEGVIKRLDLAWQAFWKGRKKGADNGPPRFKSSKLADTIPFRDAPKGYRIAPAGKGFKITMKGIPGAVKARGCFPPGVIEHRDMTLMKRDGSWFASIVVRMDARRAPGSLPLDVRLDLIDQFAVIKTANGECLAALSNPDFSGQQGGIIPAKHGLRSGSDAEAPQMRGDGNESRARCWRSDDAEAPQMRGDGNEVRPRSPADRDAEAPQMRGDGNFEPLTDAVKSDEEASQMRACADDIQSDGDSRFKKFSRRWKREKARVARIKAREARQRKHALHVWSTRIVNAASGLTVTKPASIKDQTASGRGDAKNWGAAVETKATLNRAVLESAPASAVAMLEYKAAEAGIPFVLIEDEAPAIGIGNEIVASTKAGRRAARIVKKEKAA